MMRDETKTALTVIENTYNGRHADQARASWCASGLRQAMCRGFDQIAKLGVSKGKPNFRKRRR